MLKKFYSCSKTDKVIGNHNLLQSCACLVRTKKNTVVCGAKKRGLPIQSRVVARTKSQGVNLAWDWELSRSPNGSHDRKRMLKSPVYELSHSTKFYTKMSLFILTPWANYSSKRICTLVSVSLLFEIIFRFKDRKVSFDYVRFDFSISEWRNK